MKLTFTYFALSAAYKAAAQSVIEDSGLDLIVETPGVDHDLTRLFHNYGCYCSQVFGRQEIAENGEPMDYVDKACYELIKCMRCSDRYNDDGSECPMYDKHTKMRNTLLFNNNDQDLKAQCCEDNEKKCNKAQCVCFSKFNAYIAGRSLLLSKWERSKQQMLEENFDANCGGTAQSDFYDCPADPDDGSMGSGACDGTFPMPERGDKIATLSEKCWEVREFKEKKNMYTIDATGSLKDLKKDHPLGMFESLGLTKDCSSNMQMIFNEQDGSLGGTFGGKKKCIFADQKDIDADGKDVDLKWARCDQAAEFQVVGEYLYLANTNYCLGSNRLEQSANYGAVLARKDDNMKKCLKVKMNPAFDEDVYSWSEEDKHGQCQTSCDNLLVSHYTACYNDCRERIADFQQNGCVNTCDGDECCLFKCKEWADAHAPVREDNYPNEDELYSGDNEAPVYYTGECNRADYNGSCHHCCVPTCMGNDMCLTNCMNDCYVNY